MAITQRTNLPALARVHTHIVHKMACLGAARFETWVPDGSLAEDYRARLSGNARPNPTHGTPKISSDRTGVFAESTQIQHRDTQLSTLSFKRTVNESRYVFNTCSILGNSILFFVFRYIFCVVDLISYLGFEIWAFQDHRPGVPRCPARFDERWL